MENLYPDSDRFDNVFLLLDVTTTTIIANTSIARITSQGLLPEVHVYLFF